MKNVLTTMKLNPITLVDCIVAPIGRVANVKLKQEAAVQRARWVNRDRIMEGIPLQDAILVHHWHQYCGRQKTGDPYS